MARDEKKTPYQLKFSPYKLAPSHPPPLPVGQADVGLSGIPADLFHSHSSGASEEWIYVGTSDAPGFQNGWLNYDAGRAASFKKTHGTVFLTGLVKTGTIPATIFTLPVEYRHPQPAMYFATVANSAFGSMEILSNGDVVARNGSNIWFSISCSFRPE